MYIFWCKIRQKNEMKTIILILAFSISAGYAMDDENPGQRSVVVVPNVSDININDYVNFWKSFISDGTCDAALFLMTYYRDFQ